MRRHTSVAILAAVAMLGLAACGGGGPAAGGAPVSGGTVTMRLNADTGTLDPAIATSGGMFVDTFLYDPLVNLDLTGKVVGGIAEKWDVTPNSATFTLRDDVTCSDGHKITATDVKASYDRLKDPNTHAVWIESQLGTLAYTVTADDAARTVGITLEQPFGDLIYGVAQIAVVCPSGLADPSKLTQGSAGTGPFVLETATPDVEYRLKAREGYKWGLNGASSDAAGFPAAAVFKIVKDDATAVNMFSRGDVNLLVMSGTESDRLAADPSVTMRKDLSSMGYYMVYNQLPGRISTDLDVRRAVAMAVQRKDLIAVQAGGQGKVTDSLVTASPVLCDDSAAAPSVPQFDPAGANALLDKAGWTPGPDKIRVKDGKKLALTLMATDANKASMEYLQQAFAAIGAQATVRSVDFNAGTQALFGGGDWDLTFIRFSTNLPVQWLPFLSGKQPPNGQNLSSGNPEYAKLATQAKQTPGAAGCALWVQAAQASLSSVDLLPLISPVGHWFGRGVTVETNSDVALIPTSLRVTG